MQELTYENFASSIASGIVVVDFYATRCGPCKQLAPYLEKLAEQTTGKVTFYKVDVDAQWWLAIQESIRAMPTMKIYKDGSLFKEIIWADLQTLTDTLRGMIS